MYFFGARIPDTLCMAFVCIKIKFMPSGWMISVAICQAKSHFVCVTFPEVYGRLRMTTRFLLCVCTCSSGSRYLWRHASSDTDFHMIGHAFIDYHEMRYICILFILFYLFICLILLQ